MSPKPNPGRWHLVWLLFLLVAGAAPAPLLADSAGVRLLEQAELETIFQEIIQEKTRLPLNKLKIANFSARPHSLTIPRGPLGYRLINQVHGSFVGRKSLSVLILVDGKEYGTVRLNGDLQLHGPAVRVTRKLGRREILQPEDLELVEQDISMLGSDLISDPLEAVGKQLKTSLRPGAILFGHLLKAVPVVKRGDLVTIVAGSKQVQVRAPGQVRDQGAPGDSVRVKNLMSRKEVLGVVRDAQTVSVDF